MTMTTTRLEERFYTLWLTQRLLAEIERQLRQVGYCAELDEYVRPFAAWVVDERRFVDGVYRAEQAQQGGQDANMDDRLGSDGRNARASARGDRSAG